MRRRNPLDHAAPSFRRTRGFGGRSRISRSSSVRAMVHQVLHSGACIAGHRATGILDELVVSVSRAGDGLWPGIGWRFRHTGQHRLGEGVHERKESLLTPANSGDVPRNAIKPSRYSLFGSSLFPPSVQLILDRRADERTGARVAPRLRGLLDLMLVFPAETDGNSGAPRCS